MLEDKPHHKHLGITLQNNCKWDEHISNISSKVNMLINCLRHFKYKLRRKALEITELYRNSFFPSTTLLWNNLPVNIQESSSLSEFKRYLTNNDTKVPSYYYSGQRMEQIIHCRLRLQMSDLNFDLFNRHLTENQSCACGHPFETAEHFLLLCPNYHDIRKDTLMQIEDNYLDIQILLFGNRSLGTHQNEFIFKKVHEFIRRTRRF